MAYLCVWQKYKMPLMISSGMSPYIDLLEWLVDMGLLIWEILREPQCKPCIQTRNLH